MTTAVAKVAIVLNFLAKAKMTNEAAAVGTTRRTLAPRRLEMQLKQQQQQQRRRRQG